LLRRWVNQPLNSLEKINDRQNCVECFVDNVGVFEQLTSLLHNFGDLERLISRISSGRATTRDVVSLAYSLEKLPKIIELLNSVKTLTVENDENY
jgi:DNA mismatch repair protein MutS